MLKKTLLGGAALISLFIVYVVYSLRAEGFLRTPQYDTVAPSIPKIQQSTASNILVLSKTNSFIHKEGIPAATKMLAELAVENGWNLYQTDNAATHNALDLSRFDVVVWNNTSGDILTLEQRQAFRTWLVSGGKWLGLHAAGGDTSYDWDWYVNTLLGAQFFAHTTSPQFQTATVSVADKSALTLHLPALWSIPQEEWYAFDRNPRDTGSSILLALEESSYRTDEWLMPDPSMPGEHPIAWTHPLGQGKVIYSAIGHTAATYSLASYRTFIANAINQLAAHQE